LSKNQIIKNDNGFAQIISENYLTLAISSN